MMVHKKDRGKKTFVHEATPEKEETSTITEEDYRRICLCGSALNLFACCFFVASGTLNRHSDHRETEHSVSTAGKDTCNHEAIPTKRDRCG